MKITKLELKNFKRFDDLTIDMTSLAEPAKLVLLIGTNGSGKSSVFDAFELINKGIRRGGIPGGYYNKYTDKDYEIFFQDETQENINFKTLFSGGRKFNLQSFYGRTSVRQIPKLTRLSLGQNRVSFVNDTDRPETFIERDNRFENDIEKVASSILTDVFQSNESPEAIKERYINPINTSFENIFGLEDGIKIKLISIKPPLEGRTAEILFEKGSSQIPYDYLSSGEKEIFNILLNLLTRKEYFLDTIYFLDEIDLHLNTALQKNLLKEITENWIPDNCQLWTASHSLGFIEYANEAAHAAIIDFDSLNFDVPQVITPSPKNNADVFEIAVSKEFLANVLSGKRIVFSENKDTLLFNDLNIDNVVFFNGNDKNDVFYKSKNTIGYDGLVDKDFLSDEERNGLLRDYKNLFILKYYSSENYLYHPDNLEEYYKNINKDFSKDNYIQSIKSEKNKVIGNILISVARARDSYPFYKDKEKGNDEKLKVFRKNETSILDMLNSDDFETFYKVFPAKDYGTQIKERQNLNRAELAKTNWFKSKIEEVLTK